MVIHLGEAEVLERHVPQPLDRRVDFDRAGAHLVQKRAKLVVIHTLRG